MVKQLDHSDHGEIERRVRLALAAVRDPEIPPLSIADLGIVHAVRVTRESVEVDLLPTFAGCPALDVIRRDAFRAATEAAGARQIRIRFVLSPPWTSDRITPAGREALRTYGLAPPGRGSAVPGGGAFVPAHTFLRREVLPVACPYCGSVDTELESAFGPTLCRATHFCRACRNPFEAFKAKSG